MFTTIIKKAVMAMESLEREGEVEQGAAITPLCQTCKWRNATNPVVCEAFPDGIPVVILMDGFNHRQYYDQNGVSDNGIVYQEKEAAAPVNILGMTI